jgi:putative flippase GtrA
VAEFLRFSLVGLVSFALDVGALVTLHNATAFPLALDTALAFAIASLFNFVASRQWVFPDASRIDKPHADFARYALLVGAGLLLTTLIVPVLAATGLDYRLAKLAASLVVALLNFVVMPRWVFR